MASPWLCWLRRSVPRIVRQSAEFLADTTEHYAFVSSLSVYADDSEPGQDESGPLVTLEIRFRRCRWEPKAAILRLTWPEFPPSRP